MHRPVQFEVLLSLGPAEGQFSLAVIGTMGCIVVRNLTMQKQIDRVIGTPLWSTVPREKRQALFIIITKNKPMDVNNFDEMAARYVSAPTKMAPIVMYVIMTLINPHLGDDDTMKLMAALAAFTVGGIGIGGTRHGSIALDRLFRCVFGAGFVAILHYLAEASDAVLIKSAQ